MRREPVNAIWDGRPAREQATAGRSDDLPLGRKGSPHGCFRFLHISYGFGGLVVGAMIEAAVNEGEVGMLRSTSLRPGEGRIVGAFLVVTLLLLAWLLWLNLQPPFAGTLSTQTVSECRPGQDSSTTLCYSPAEPT